MSESVNVKVSSSPNTSRPLKSCASSTPSISSSSFLASARSSDDFLSTKRRSISVSKIGDTKSDDILEKRGRKILLDTSPKGRQTDKHGHSPGEIKKVLNSSSTGKKGSPGPKEKERRHGIFVTRSHASSAHDSGTDDDDEDSEDTTIISALVRNSEVFFDNKKKPLTFFFTVSLQTHSQKQKDTFYKIPVKLKPETYKPKELLKILRNCHSHLSLISFQYIEDCFESTKAFMNYEQSVVC